MPYIEEAYALFAIVQLATLREQRALYIEEAYALFAIAQLATLRVQLALDIEESYTLFATHQLILESEESVFAHALARISHTSAENLLNLA
ncbi:MAG: hypothetical protein WCF19_04305 [Chlamydiales bacterium]